MRNKILVSALILSGCIGLTGCSDFLESEDKSNVESEKYFMTAEGFENLSATPYYKLRAIYDGSTVDLFLSGTDLYEAGRSNYADASLATYKTLNAENGTLLSFYKACYDGIQQANTVIDYAGKGAAGSNVQKRMNEAKYLKAFYYYLLTQQFGGVPVSDSYITSVITSFPRKTQGEVYEYIINMLKEVETANVLPESDNTGRASMRAVYNLMAKVYLAWAWDYDTSADDEGNNVTVNSKERFALAATYADKAIAGKTPALSFKDMWDVKNDNNDEILFAIQYTRGISGQDETTTGNRQMAYYGNYYNDDVDASKYTNSQYPASEKLIYLFEPGDDRFEGTFMVEQLRAYHDWYTTGIGNDTEVLYYFPAWYTDLSNLQAYNQLSKGREQTNIFSTSDPCKFVKVSINKRTGKITYTPGSQSYSVSRKTTSQSICVRKFDDYESKRNTTKGVSFHNIVLAHLTESYLLAAEAYHMAGDDTKSLQRLNTVRERSHAETLTSFASYKRHYSDGTDNSVNMGSGIANVPFETGLDPIDVILDERARELCGEFYRWMDLRRTKRLVSYNVKYNSGVTSVADMKGPDGKVRWFRPLPQDVINLNEAITDKDQNPGYNAAAETAE